MWNSIGWMCKSKSSRLINRNSLSPATQNQFLAVGISFPIVSSIQAILILA